MQTKPERTSHDFTYTSTSADSQFQWDPSGYAFMTLCEDSGIHFTFFFLIFSTLFSSCLCGNLSWDKWFLLQTAMYILNLRLYSTFSEVAVQPLSWTWLFANSWTAAHQAPLSFTISWSLLKFISTQSVMLFNHLILCLPFSFCPQSFPASGSFPVSWLFTTGDQSTGAFSKIIHFIYLTVLCGMWDLSSPTRGGTQVPCTGRV